MEIPDGRATTKVGSKRGREYDPSQPTAPAAKKQDQDGDGAHQALLDSMLREYNDQERRWDNPDEEIQKDFCDFIDHMTNFLSPKGDEGTDRLKFARRIFVITSSTYNSDEVTEAYSKWTSILLRLHLQLKFSRMEYVQQGRLTLAIFAAIRVVAAAKNSLRSDLELLQAIDPKSERMGTSKDADREVLFQELGDRPSDGEVVARHVLKELYAHRYGRRNNAVFRRVFTEDGINTCTWTRLCDIKEFIHTSLNHIGAAHVTSLTWKNPRVVDGVEKWLKECKHPWFPEIVPKRGLYSFRNGVLSVESAPVRFWSWDDPSLPCDIVACKYFDQEFDPDWTTCEDIDAIPTPAADKVIEYQLIPKVKASPDPEELKACKDDEERARLSKESFEENLKETLEWVYALMGRLQHPVRKHDNWEVLLTVIGRAGTGKSTLMEAIMSMYDKDDVRQLSGNADQFSIASLVGGLLWMCTEMSDKVRIPQMQLQQMVTGESMAVRPIHEKWIHIPRWESPGVIGGNVLPPWADNQGSLTRRLLVLTFGRAIENHVKDPKLKDKLSQQMGAFICKTARYYFQAVEAFGGYILWADCPVKDEDGNNVLDEDGKEVRVPVLPPYFHEQSAAVKRELDPLRMFLAESPFQWSHYRGLASASFKKEIEENKPIRIRTSDKEVLANMMYCMPFSVFKERAIEFMNDLGKDGKDYKWKESVYREALIDNDLFLFQPSGSWMYGEKAYGGKWIAGICETTALVESHPIAINLAEDVARDEAAAGGGGAEEDEEEARIDAASSRIEALSIASADIRMR